MQLNRDSHFKEFYYSDFGKQRQQCKKEQLSGRQQESKTQTHTQKGGNLLKPVLAPHMYLIIQLITFLIGTCTEQSMNVVLNLVLWLDS